MTNVTETSIIWFPGEAAGHTPLGESADAPTRKVATGEGAPEGAPSGSPFYLDTVTDSLYAWDGTEWLEYEVAAGG